MYTIEKDVILFKKYRQIPIDLKTLDIIIPRLSEDYVTILPKLRHDAARMQKGYNGERKLDYHLKQLSDEYDILCDVTLRWRGAAFQIDTLIISPSAIFIVSVKSLDGIITFQPHNRTLIQEINGKTTRYECPILQAERHKSLLIKWLEERNLFSIPIYYVIGIAEMSTTIRTEDENISRHIQYIEYIPNYIRKLNQQHEQIKNIPLQKQITHQILQSTEIFQTDYLRKYNIPKKAIMPGVVCKNCNQLNVQYINGMFKCSECGKRTNNEALQSLYDLMFIYNLQRITNHQAMHMMGLHNRHQTLRLLKESDLIIQTNTRKWHLSTNPKFPQKVE